jgi:lysozyme
MSLRAADISHYQSFRQPIIWPSVIAAGIDLMGIKATEDSGYVDPDFAPNRQGARPIKYRLFYHWLSPNSPVKDQAFHFLRTIGPLMQGEGTMVDVEEAGDTAASADEFADRVEQVTQRPVTGYTGAFFAGGTVWHSPTFYKGGNCGDRARIIAAYTDEAHMRQYAAPEVPDMWQYTGTGSLPGIVGAVDLSVVYNTKVFDVACGYDTKPPVPPTPYDPNHHLFGLWPIARKANVLVGSSGPAVTYLQDVFVHQLGYTMTVDGIFGTETDRFVRWFQATHGLMRDGLVGPYTWAEVDKEAQKH